LIDGIHDLLKPGSFEFARRRYSRPPNFGHRRLVHDHSRSISRRLSGTPKYCR
jgi:hypothetical protein